jgi:hypothetical protein
MSRLRHTSALAALAALAGVLGVPSLPAAAAFPPPQPVGGGKGSVLPDTTPTALRPPAIVGRALVGRTLRARPPRWSATPTVVAYRWQLCAGRRCRPIPGATRLRLRLLPAWVRRRVRIVATASITGATVVTRSGSIAVRIPRP